MRRFVVAARAPASVLFRPGDELSVPVEFDGGKYELTFKTRHLNRGLSALVPGDLWLHAEGDAESLEEAASRFVNFGRTIGNLIGLAANAYVGDLEPEIIFECTPGVENREFFQRFVGLEKPSLVSRFVDVDPTSGFVNAVQANPEHERLLRSLSQYMTALSYWQLGHSLLCVSHLFMAAEALKRATWRNLLRTSKVTREDLAKQWGFDASKNQNIESFLDAQARVRLVFHDDNKCHAGAKGISDAFEHGYKGPGELHFPADAVRIAAAAHVRKAIFETSWLDEPDMDSLLGSKFEIARGPSGVDFQLRGHLNGGEDRLAADGNQYPCVEWVNEISDVKFDPTTEQYTLVPGINFTGSFAPSVRLKVSSIKAFDKSRWSPEPIT